MRKENHTTLPLIRDILFAYTPFGRLFYWDTSTITKFLVCLFVFLPLIYGFLGLADPFNVINYILVVPLYFALGSTLIRDLYKRVYDANKLDDKLTYTRPVIAKLPLDIIIFVPVILSLIVQLIYIYDDLGFGIISSGGQAPFAAFFGLFRQNWIVNGFPVVFFALYIIVQFIALWFALIVVIALIDIIIWFIKFFKIRKHLFISDTRYKEADVWIHNTNKALSGISWLSMALSLNGFTYRSQIKNGSTLNYDGFMVLAILLLFLSVCIKATLIFTKDKYLLDHYNEDPQPVFISSDLLLLELLSLPFSKPCQTGECCRRTWDCIKFSGTWKH